MAKDIYVVTSLNEETGKIEYFNHHTREKDAINEREERALSQNFLYDVEKREVYEDQDVKEQLKQLYDNIIDEEHDY